MDVEFILSLKAALKVGPVKLAAVTLSDVDIQLEVVNVCVKKQTFTAIVGDKRRRFTYDPQTKMFSNAKVYFDALRRLNDAMDARTYPSPDFFGGYHMCTNKLVKVPIGPDLLDLAAYYMALEQSGNFASNAAKRRMELNCSKKFVRLFGQYVKIVLALHENLVQVDLQSNLDRLCKDSRTFHHYALNARDNYKLVALTGCKKPAVKFVNSVIFDQNLLTEIISYY